MSLNSQVDNLLFKIRTKYPSLLLGYEYVEEENYYDIWHNDKKLEMESIEFSSFVGELLDEYFFSKCIYNIAFGYDYSKSELAIDSELKKFVYSFFDCNGISFSYNKLISKPILFKNNLNNDNNTFIIDTYQQDKQTNINVKAA